MNPVYFPTQISFVSERSVLAGSRGFKTLQMRELLGLVTYGQDSHWKLYSQANFLIQILCLCVCLFYKMLPLHKISYIDVLYIVSVKMGFCHQRCMTVFSYMQLPFTRCKWLDLELPFTNLPHALDAYLNNNRCFEKLKLNKLNMSESCPTVK